VGNGNAVREPVLSQASLSSFGHESDLNTLSNNYLVTIAQKTLPTIRDLLWLLTSPGDSKGKEHRWGR
jgi:hypothetical protein